MTTKIETDVLVVGGGGAGFRAAIGAREKGADVLLLARALWDAAGQRRWRARTLPSTAGA